MAVPIPLAFIEWVIVPFGLDVPNILGAQMLAYLRGPVIAGYPTFAMAFLYALLFTLTTLVWARTLNGAADSWKRSSVRELFVGRDETWVLANAGLWGYGGLMTALSVVGPPTYRHYMICVTPLMMLFCAQVVFEFNASRKRLLLGMLVGIQALASYGLLAYIHQTQIIHAEYGPTWRSQQPDFTLPGRCSTDCHKRER